MIVFCYKGINSVKDCHFILEGMEIPGDPIEESITDAEGGSALVWGSDDFLALYHSEDSQLELYGIKNTNSINYFIMRYPKLDWDTWKQVKTKRW